MEVRLLLLPVVFLDVEEALSPSESLSLELAWCETEFRRDQHTVALRGEQANLLCGKPDRNQDSCMDTEVSGD